MNSKTIDGARLAGALIDIHNDSLEYNPVLRNFEPPWQLSDETLYNDFLIHPNNRIEGTTQSDVGNIGSAQG
jgi:hypothetical protein